MGQVWRAYDPKLEREVALKLLRTQTLDPEARVRLVREARAMAKLSHPNVVQVFDVADSDSGLMVVMECVRGATLRTWLQGDARPPPEIIARLIEAGRGLAAAHAVGLLHRDFKPSNVLLSMDGVAKVTDFGLAKLGVQGSLSTSGITAGSGGSLNSALMAHEVIMGTPRYMAPEQHRGDALSPRADQYAFCVSLWEALIGYPPFSGDYRELSERKLRGPPAWPGQSAVPARIVGAITRGRSVDPEQRWPDLRELLDVLAEDPSARRRWAARRGGSLVVGGAFATTWADPTVAHCSGAAAQLESVWDPSRRSQVEAAFVATDEDYAPQVWLRVDPQLDTYAQTWRAVFTEACEATTVRRERSEDVMDLQMGCLQQSKQRLAAVTDVLSTADATVVRRAHKLVAGLDPLERCTDIDALRAGNVPPEPEDAVERARALLAEVNVYVEAGLYPAARERLDHAERQLQGVTFEPVWVELALERGALLCELGDYEESTDAYRYVLEHGPRTNQWAAVRAALLTTIATVGVDRARRDEGLMLIDLAEGMAEAHLSSQAKLRNIYGLILNAQGKHAEAEVELRRSIALWQQGQSTQKFGVLRPYTNLAAALVDQGRYAEAEQESRDVLRMAADLLGPDHPFVAFIYTNLGNAIDSQGNDGKPELQRALALHQNALGPEHPLVATAHSNYGAALLTAGELDDALREFRRAKEITSKTRTAEHSVSLGMDLNIACVLVLQGKLEEAEGMLFGLLERFTKALGPEHQYVGYVLENLGTSYLGLGKHNKAIAHYRRAIENRRISIGAEHPYIYRLELQVVRVMVAQQEYAQAVSQLLDLMPAIVKSLGPSHSVALDAELCLGTIWSAQGHHKRAEHQYRELLEAALGTSEPDLEFIAQVRDELAQVLLMRQGRAQEAVSVAEQAWRYYEQVPSAVEKQAATSWTLAQALWASGAQHRARAQTLARNAVALYRQRFEAGIEPANRIEHWLRTHR